MGEHTGLGLSPARLRFDPSCTPHHGFASEEFVTCNDMLGDIVENARERVERVLPDDEDYDTGEEALEVEELVCGVYQPLFELFERVIRDSRTFVGRDDALLNLWMGDQSEEERAYYALRLNAPEVARPLLEAYELAPTILGGNRSRPSGRN